ncbi:MAG: tetratricopeptide repeat protein [Fibrobacteres bacterium]|nr:tetratricopeptide repeat protein [Fibrobacterota bacterium]
METVVTKSSLFLRLALAGAFGLLSATYSHADAKLQELKKRKMELDQAAAKCDAMDESEKSDCMAKRQKKVDKYREELDNYKNDLAKEQSKASQREAKESPADFNSKIQNREQSIKEFQDYVNSCSEKTDRCASALFQVANLTYQNEEDGFLVKQNKYEEEFRKWEDHDKKGGEPNQPRRDHKNSIRYFERFLKEYPNHKQVPEALVRAAFISDMLGNEDRAYEYLNLLVTRFPEHPLNIQAHLRLGEYWLLKRKYAKAIEQYEKVPVDYPGNEAGLALYHRAEAYYNLADFDNAARWYYEYVVRADAGKLKADLRDEAMAFMAASWADMDNGFEAAEKFLSAHGNPKWEKDVYYEIGLKNKGHDRLDESVKSFKFLLEKDPAYPKAPVADLNIVEILVLQKKAEEAQQARMDLVKRYESNSEWSRRNSGNSEAMAEAAKAIKIAMYHIPVYYHQKGDEGKGDPDMLRKAEEHYRNYLSRYSGENSWDVYQVHQNLAVLYNKLKDFKRSADEWQWCAAANTDRFGKLPPEKKDIVTKGDAAYNSVLMMDENRKEALKRLKDDKTAAYNSQETRDYFKSVEKYMSQFGKSNSAPELAYNAAFVDYEAKQYKEAIQSLSRLADQFPNHEHNVLIRRALAQSLLEDGQYDLAEKQFTVLKNKLCPSDKQCAEIKKALASTIFKQADTKAKSGDHATAAQKYIQLAREFRDVDIADKALFEAGVNFDSAGRTEDGVRTLLRIHAEYPKSELRIKSILKGASMYMAKKKFRDAAETFLLIQKNYPDDSLGFQSIAWAADAYEKVPDPHKAGQTYESAFRLYPTNMKTPSYLYNAGQLYENNKEFGDAIAVYKLIGDKFPKSQYAIEAIFSVPLLLEKRGDYAKAATAYEDFVKDFENDKNKLIRAHLGAGKNYENLGNETKALDHFGKAIAIQKKDGEKAMIPPAIAAEAGYRAGEIYFKKIKKIRLDGSKGQNAQRVGEMQKALVPSIQYYAKAVEMGEEEWTLRSTLRMGDLFYAIASISDNERAAGLSGDDRIRAKIESKAGIPGYLEKAQELYKKNLEIANNQGIESPWVDSSGLRLMQAYSFKGDALEDLSKLFLQVPLPKKAGEEEKAQLKQASEETKEKAIANYKEGLLAAQTYHIDNDARQKIVARLRDLAADSPEINAQVTPRPKSAPEESAPGPGKASESATASIDFKDAKYEANLKRIAKIYENSSLSEDQKIELLLQMETEAKREIGEMNAEMASPSSSDR